MRLGIRKKDTVVVLTGRDRGKRGEVLRIIAGRDGTAARVVVSKVNIVTSHEKPRQTQPGGIQKKEGSIAVSNVMLLCPKCDKAIRPKRDRLQSGERVRLCRKCSEVIL
ncbi:MAG: 50S ribosomal protein L24 [Elusimicrobia bacterium]|nr:50S ribosomal protein L24 [Elusimicrobiota bacterium]